MVKAGIMKKKMKLAASDRTFYVVDYTLLVFAGLVVLFPLLNVFSQAFSEPQMVLSGRVSFWPRNFTVETVRLILGNRNIMTGFANTLWYTGIGTAINLVMTIMCAYPLSRIEFRGRNYFMFIFAFTMMFSGGMIPTYMNIKNLGLLNSRWVMVLPGALTVWNMVLARTFFQNTIPKEMFESAEMDGASDFRVLVSIVMPLSVPILAVLTLFYAVGHWNSYFDAMMYLTSPRLYNIQLILRNAITNIQNLMNETFDLANLENTMAFGEASKYALIVISTVPVLIIYPFVQKYFIKGIMIGALKG
jgi:ABC-type glycerol-3-phosphate transport system permease component